MMDAKEVLAIVLNRGLQPKIGGLGVLDFDGDPKGMTPALLDAVKLHEPALLRLVASNWSPPTRGAGETPIAPFVLTPGSEKARFDWEAERLIRDLYATDHGIRWKPSGMSIFPHDDDPRLAAWLKRAKPMRDRIEEHIRPRDAGTHGIELQHKDGGKTITVRHPIRTKPEPKRAVKTLPVEEEKNGTPESTRQKTRSDWPITGWGTHEYRTPETWIYVVEEDHVFQWEPPVLFTAWRYMLDRCEYWRMLWGRWVFIGNRWEWIRWGARQADGKRFA